MDVWKKDAAQWLPCPVCHQTKMIKYNSETVLKSFPAYCKRCRKERIIDFDARQIK